MNWVKNFRITLNTLVIKLLTLFIVTIFSFSVIANASEAGSRFVFFSIGDLPLQAELVENRALLNKISPSPVINNAIYYRGHLTGYPDSSVRVSEQSGLWQGIVVFEDKLYRVVEQSSQSPLTIALELNTGVQSEAAICASPEHSGAHLDESSSNFFQPALSTSLSINVNHENALASATTPCANPIDGVCLLPNIEFAYDLDYQNLPTIGGITPLERAVQEINELELFFERGFNYRFNQLSLTMLNAVQDQIINTLGYQDGIYNLDDPNDPNDLVRHLKNLRRDQNLDFLQSQFSIFHLVTGRNFPPVSAGNVIGIAFPNQICSGQGANVGITDAGDTGFVALVMAHEIGHNFGAGHDSLENSCAANNHVMTASIGGNGFSITDFSSCSIAEILQKVDQRASASCFQYPVDMSIQSSVLNPAEPPKEIAFNTIFDVNVVEGELPGGFRQIRIEGVLPDPTQGEFLAVNAAGQACSILSAGASYRCDLIEPPASLQVVAATIVNDQAATYVAEHSVQSITFGTIDLVASNDNIVIEFNTFGDGSGVPPATIPPVGVSQGGDNTPASNSGSSGGGGTISLSVLAVLMAALFSRLFSFFAFLGCRYVKITTKYEA